jgi:two-component system cell cycle response regulator DivK
VAEVVLVVDDDERNARLVCAVLQRAGIDTLTASTAAEALTLAAEHEPALVLMDLRLPDLDGDEAVRRLHADARTCEIPVVALSALRLAHAAWFREAGFAGYIEKPVDIGALPEQIRAYLQTG